MNIIDELGLLNQTIAQLEASARKLKAELIARGVTTSVVNEPPIAASLAGSVAGCTHTAAGMPCRDA